MKQLLSATLCGILALGACTGNKNTHSGDTAADSLKTFLYEGNPVVRDKVYGRSGSHGARWTAVSLCRT